MKRGNSVIHEWSGSEIKWRAIVFEVKQVIDEMMKGGERWKGQ
jgi:hypothetical protein